MKKGAVDARNERALATGCQRQGEKDPFSRRLMEEILAKEEEHADEMADLLFAVEPESGEMSRRLYFKDEIPGESDAGQPVKTAATVKHSAKKAARR